MVAWFVPMLMSAASSIASKIGEAGQQGGQAGGQAGGGIPQFQNLQNYQPVQNDPNSLPNLMKKRQMMPPPGMGGYL